MIRVFNKLLKGETLFPIQNAQYAESIPLIDSVEAGQTKLCKAAISSLGHFLCYNITGHYETLYTVSTDGGDLIVDDGICHLRGQLIDGAGQRLLFSEHVPFDLFLSPGRTRTTNAVNNLEDITHALRADPAPGLFYPIDEEYLFTANSDIQLSIKNDSNTTIAFALRFAGIRILTPKR